MKEFVADFTSHLRQALEIARNANLPDKKFDISDILILGMGGSGIGGTIASQVLSEKIGIPVLSCKDYVVPGFVSKKTLVIVSSYSGNTEETLIALESAEKKTSNILCLTSGGKLKEIANRRGYGCITIPSGFPPRAAFGFSFPQLFRLLEHAGVLSSGWKTNFESSIALLDSESDSIKKRAYEIAGLIKNKITVIYAQSDYEGVCIRFRQQLNENSKKLCWHHVIPEMNHNELVGWREKNKDLAVVFIRNQDEHPRNKLRIELNKKIISEYCSDIIEIESRGADKLQKTLYLVHLCDWISVAISDLNHVDPIEIEVINFLKSELSGK